LIRRGALTEQIAEAGFSLEFRLQAAPDSDV
jgi:hypothetical protein